MERQATQPAAVPSGRKRRRVSSKKPKGKEEVPVLDMKATRDLEMAQIGLSRAEAEALEMKATQPPTSELVVVLKALPQAEDPLPPPTPSPVCSVNELMEGTLKDYEEECVEEGTFHSDPTTEVGEWEVLDQMDTQFNQLLYESCPFHPHRFLECVNPQSNFGPLRFKCSQEGCPVYLFEDTREVMMKALKKRHASSSPCPIETRRTQVPMWVRSQDEVKSHRQELQQSVFQLWELCPWERTLWLLSMAPWPLVVSPRASATYPETMGQGVSTCPSSERKRPREGEIPTLGDAPCRDALCREARPRDRKDEA